MRLLISMLFLLIAVSAQAQPSYSYGVNGYYGAVFRYKSGMPKLSYTHLHGVEAFLMKQTVGERYWEKKYNLPKLGLAMSYFNYGVPDELGEVYSLTGFIDSKLLKFGKGSLRANLGTGLVYSTLFYHTESNPGNKAVGAPVSYVLRGTLYYNLPISERWDINFNAAFRHYSNGKMNVPNNGMNFPILGAGVAYKNPIKNRVPTKERTIQPDEKLDQSLRFSLYAATAWREVWRDDIKHKAYSISAMVSRRMNYYYSLNAGVDGFYYSPKSIVRHFSPQGIKLTEEEVDGRQAAVTLGTEIYLGKTSLVYQGGLYVYDPHRPWSRWYQRYAIKYALLSHAFIQIGLKTHSRTANMIEWGIGLSL